MENVKKEERRNLRLMGIKKKWRKCRKNKF